MTHAQILSKEGKIKIKTEISKYEESNKWRRAEAILSTNYIPYNIHSHIILHSKNKTKRKVKRKPHNRKMNKIHRTYLVFFSFGKDIFDEIYSLFR